MGFSQIFGFFIHRLPSIDMKIETDWILWIFRYFPIKELYVIYMVRWFY